MFTATDLANIRTAIARGEHSVQFSDRLVTYRSVQELIDAEAHIAASLSTRPRQFVAYANKGFDTEVIDDPIL